MKFSRCVVTVFFACCSAVGALAHAQTAPARHAIVAGEATLVIGSPSIERMASMQPAAMHRGGDILVGDRLRTGAGDQVNVRLADGGLLVVRPNSTFVITEFTYQPAEPKATVVKYQLEEGQARIVSGTGVQASKDKFRLNTPVAAIGVRGTDFTVTHSAALGNTLVTVTSGEVVATTFGADCTPDGLGPCGRLDASLSAAEPGAALLIQATMVTKGTLEDIKNMLPDGAEQLQGIVNADASESQEADKDAKPKKDTAEAETAKNEGDKPGSKVTAQAQMEPLASDRTNKTDDTLDVLAYRDTAAQSVADRVGDSANTYQAQPTDVIQWFGTSNLPNGVVQGPQASGDLDNYENVVFFGGKYLFRKALDNGLERDFSLLSGEYQFGLIGGEASRVTGSSVVGLTYNRASLSINFDDMAFKTALGLADPAGNVYLMGAEGAVGQYGQFFRNDGGSALSGAIANDLSGAGYAFRVKNGDSIISGSTIWEVIK